MLTELKIRNLKPRDRLYRITDAQNLCLEITPQGSLLWRFRYRWAGKNRIISLGPYPVVSLAAARERRLEAQRQLQNGKDPARAKREQREGQAIDERAQFPAFAREWLERKQSSVKPSTYRKAFSIIEGDLIPAFRDASIATLTTPEAMRVLERIEARAPHMAEKAKGYLTQMIDYAIKRGIREDGKFLALRGAVWTPKAISVPAATTQAVLAKVMAAIDQYDGAVTQAALRFAALTTMRPMNIVQARWEQIDFHERTWTIPGEAMKTGDVHTVPLPNQALALLETAKAWKTRDGWIFPALSMQKTPHLHRDTLSKALRASGLQGTHVPHGFRSSFRTLAREEFGIAEDILEAQITHAKKGAVRKAYDRTRFIKQRTEVMQRWADYLDELR